MFPKLRVSEMLRIRPGRGVLDFPSKLFCLTVPKLSLREPFCAVLQINFRQRKSFWKKGNVDYEDFPSKIFCLTVPKFFSENLKCFNHFRYQKKVGIRENSGIHDFLQNCFVSQCRKFS